MHCFAEGRSGTMVTNLTRKRRIIIDGYCTRWAKNGDRSGASMWKGKGQWEDEGQRTCQRKQNYPSDSDVADDVHACHWLNG